MAGQAGLCPHTMTVLQAYQADLLKELDEGEGVNAEDIKELRKTADLSLRATKEILYSSYNIYSSSDPISGSSLRPSALTPHFYKVCGCRISSVAAKRHPHNYIDD